VLLAAVSRTSNDSCDAVLDVCISSCAELLNDELNDRRLAETESIARR